MREAPRRKMAEGARHRLGADVVLATSDIAGLDGGTETKPVGNICTTYADQHQTASHQYTFNRGQQPNMEYTVTMALNMLRLKLPPLPSYSSIRFFTLFTHARPFFFLPRLMPIAGS